MEKVKEKPHCKSKNAMREAYLYSWQGDPVVFIDKGWWSSSVKHVAIISGYKWDSNYSTFNPTLASHTSHYEADLLKDVAQRVKDSWGSDSIVKIIRIKQFLKLTTSVFSIKEARGCILNYQYRVR